MDEASAYDKETRKRVITMEGRVQTIETTQGIHGAKLDSVAATSTETKAAVLDMRKAMDEERAAERERREAAAQWEREQAAARAAWWRSLLNPRDLTLILSALGAFITLLFQLYRNEPVDQQALVDAVLQAQGLATQADAVANP